jgi:cellulose biosynthesis protein BcsQ
MNITFYSYKGGVGRTLALANAATHLARSGFRVLVADFDLEAPGIEHYFKVPTERGLVELIGMYSNELKKAEPTLSQQLQELGTPVERVEAVLGSALRDIGQSNAGSDALESFWGEAEIVEGARIHVMSAGSRREPTQYAKAVRELSLSALYAEYAGFHLMDWLRHRFLSDWDFVFIDSRTGITEVGGVCTHHLADLNVLVTTMNPVSHAGCAHMAGSIAGYRERHGLSSNIALLVTRVSELTTSSELDSLRARVEADARGSRAKGAPAVINVGLGSLAAPHEDALLSGLGNASLEFMLDTKGTASQVLTRVSGLYQRLAFALLGHALDRREEALSDDGTVGVDLRILIVHSADGLETAMRLGTFLHAMPSYAARGWVRSAAVRRPEDAAHSEHLGEVRVDYWALSGPSQSFNRIESLIGAELVLPVVTSDYWKRDIVYDPLLGLAQSSGGTLEGARASLRAVLLQERVAIGKSPLRKTWKPVVMGNVDGASLGSSRDLSKRLGSSSDIDAAFCESILGFVGWLQPAEVRSINTTSLNVSESKWRLLRPGMSKYWPFSEHGEPIANPLEGELKSPREAAYNKIQYAETVGSARKWWDAFENENRSRPGLVARLAAELAVRDATITEFFLAYVYSNTDNIQANLDYLDYSRLKKKEEAKKQEAAAKARQPSEALEKAPELGQARGVPLEADREAQGASDESPAGEAPSKPIASDAGEAGASFRGESDAE